MAITPQQRIQIKRRNSVPASAEGWAYLLDGELGYVKDENGLYIGLGGGNSAVKVNVKSWDELKDKPSNIISQIYLNSADPTKIVYKKVGNNTEHVLGNFAPLTNGLVDLKYLPQGALERLVVVANAAARLKLTTANVQLGDTVKETDTGLMYVVVDESKLNSENGYQVYVAGRAAAVDWTGVENKVNATVSSAGLMSATDKKKLDNTNIAYGTCSTAAATAQKDIVITSQGDWSLQIGSIIVVKFTNTNTAQKPIFKVGNAAANSVWYNTALISTSNLSYAGYANRPSMYMYDGTQFVWLGWTVDSNSDTKVTQSAAITTAGEYPVLLGYSTATTSVTDTVNKAAAFTYNPNTKILTANTFKGALTGNADTATKLATARKLTIGSTGKDFDGTGALSWTLAEIGAAAASHNHSASEITSGTLAIARGGTGITSNPSMLVNLGSTTAASVFAASPRPGVTGTLPVANGGTGKTTAKDAANALINALETGTSKPADGDYYISQYVNGGTTTTTYHRRSISKLWEYMKDKIDDLYLPLTGGTLTGALTVPGIIAATPGSGAIGQSGKPFLNMHSRNFIMYDQNNIQIAQMYTNVAAGTTTSVGTSYLVLGNNKKSNVAGNAKGYLGLYSNNDKFVQLTAVDGMTSSKTITLPDAGGTVALAEKTLPLTGGTLTGALTISADGLNVTGMAKFNNVTNFFGGGYTRLYSNSSQLQLEAWASNTTTSTETMTRAVLALYHSSNLDQSVRFLKYDAGSGSTYYLYGTHNITKGTDAITAKTSKLETNCIYLQYD